MMNLTASPLCASYSPLLTVVAYFRAAIPRFSPSPVDLARLLFMSSYDDDEDDVTVVPMLWPEVTNIDDLPSTRAPAKKLAVLRHVDKEETPTS